MREEWDLQKTNRTDIIKVLITKTGSIPELTSQSRKHQGEVYGRAFTQLKILKLHLQEMHQGEQLINDPAGTWLRTLFRCCGVYYRWWKENEDPPEDPIFIYRCPVANCNVKGVPYAGTPAQITVGHLCRKLKFHDNFRKLAKNLNSRLWAALVMSA
jgi:hypothetical protein